MALQIFNSLSQRLEVLEPIEPGQVRFYTCGPTVYNFAHIGNFRAYIFEDLLRRVLKYCGFKVIQVMNLTDVDDKTIRGAIAQGVDLTAFTQTFKNAFFADLKTLRIEPAEFYPAATDHIPEMITLVETLLAKGHAYRADDGSVYFRIASFPNYGRLARLDREGLRPGARVAQDEYAKDDAADFALWKAWDAADGNVRWESPWGPGRPGWHLECSAMSMKYLGPTFDLHTGGIDNLFPHHEDEIAQSEAANGQQFVKYWMHCAHLVVDGRKMSKSLGNFYTLRDLVEKGYTGREIRYLLASANYRQSLNFTFDALQAARSSLARADEFTERLATQAGAIPPGQPAPLPGWATEAGAAFRAAVENDLNMAEALAALFRIIHDGNRALDHKELSPAQAVAVQGVLADIDGVLALLQTDEVRPDAAVQALMEQRQTARKTKQWAESDRIRDELDRLGWVIQDTPAGPKLKRRPG
jgi:cysteinyl-tRNA synthetase